MARSHRKPPSPSITTIRIQLTSDLRTKAELRADARRDTSLEMYIIDLIKKDVNAGLPAEDRVRPLVNIKKTSDARRDGSIRKLRKELLDGMFSYMKASDDPGYGYACGYGLKHIDRCAAIIDAYLARLSSKRQPTPEEGLAIVKQTVTKLNKLNNNCGGALIETDQREILCQLIQLALLGAGLRANGDITEQWREW